MRFWLQLKKRAHFFSFRSVKFISSLSFICLAFYPNLPAEPTEEKSVFKDHLTEIDQKTVGAIFPYIEKFSSDHNVSLPLILAIMKNESNFDSKAKSNAGALGLMQLMPQTAFEEIQRNGQRVSYTKLKRQLIHQPRLNINLGIRYLKWLDEKFETVKNLKLRRELVIASYNAGSMRVKRSFRCASYSCVGRKISKKGERYFKGALRKLPKETRDYLKNVKSSMNQFQISTLLPPPRTSSIFG